VSFLQRWIDSKEFAEWKAFYMLEPFGPSREDERAGMMSACVVNAHKARGRLMMPEDFFPELKDGEPEEKGVEQMKARLLKVFKKKKEKAGKNGGDRKDSGLADGEDGGVRKGA